MSKKLERGKTVDHTARLLFGKKKIDNVILGIQLGNYRNSFSRGVLMFEADPQIGAITRGEMIEFFAWLQEEYLTEPDGVAPRREFKLSAKT